MIKKYISHSGVTIEIGDFFGDGVDEVVSSFEEIPSSDVPTHVRVNTTQNNYEFRLHPGDYIGYQDGNGKVIKNEHDDDN